MTGLGRRLVLDPGAEGSVKECPEKESKQDDDGEVDKTGQCYGGLSEMEDGDVPYKSAGFVGPMEMMDEVDRENVKVSLVTENAGATRTRGSFCGILRRM